MIGFDAGTYNLVCARRGTNSDVKYKKEINAFLELPLENRYMFNMLKKAGVPLIERNDVAYVVGEAAINMAYTLNQLEMKRPMQDGCVNPREKNSFSILNVMIHSLIGEIDKDDGVLYYSVPANAINDETDVDYHQKILASIFKNYNVDNKVLRAYPINEGLALVFAELGHKAFTGAGVSAGAGMVNVSYAIYSQPVFSFSLINSGDYIDKQAAKACGETPAFINKEKMKIDLNKEPSNMVERAISTQYHIMIEKTVLGIKKGLEQLDAKDLRTEDGIDIVLGGGTASPPGFVELFRRMVDEAKWPLKIGELRKPDDHLYAVARGCLVAAENSQM